MACARGDHLHHGHRPDVAVRELVDRPSVAQFDKKRFQQAIDRQPTFEVIPANIADQIASILFVIGGGLVLSSWYHLGFTHTYLGIPSSFLSISSQLIFVE